MNNEYFKGFIIGITQNVIGHPLDTIKTNIQSNKHIVISKLYKGFSIPCITNGLVNSIAFSTYKNVYDNTNNTLIAGCIAGIAVSPVQSPIDKIKIHLQNRHTSEKIFKNIFKGMYATLCRESIAFSLYFSSYDLYKKKLPQHNKISILFSGGFAGMTSWLFTYPIDVIKTRVQSGLTYHQSIHLRNFYKGILPCLIRSFLTNSISFYIYEYL